MNELVYPRERSLGAITLIIGVLLWLALILGTFGTALIVLAVGFVFYLFAQSALIAHLKGNGVELSAAQFPDLHAHFVECCERLQIRSRPQAYVLNGNGALNAFATQFLGAQYVVLLSDIVDAMKDHPDGLRFYLGHELGHLKQKHLIGQLFRWPALWLPLLGAAYSRARESTSDRHGAACSDSREGAAKALVALAAGPDRWRQIDLAAYRAQVEHSSGFWMSLHELLSGYPWTTKRAARVLYPDRKLPSRNAFSYLVALIFPYAGRLGSGFGLLVLVYFLGVVAAIGLPAYHDYKIRVALTSALVQSKGARESLAGFYQTKRAVPPSLEAAGIPDRLPDGSSLALDSNKMILTVSTAKGALIFTPAQDAQGQITWECSAAEDLKKGQLPPACR
ncbi:M48 family metalloprotease [Niveibacterium terrae]|uniref:M48 family metalloprotease n=1 Tax=Niveibacterium terrae TaxID=3373598 RepID=UPI003A91777C